MRVILQRVSKASVTIDNKVTASIEQGLLVFLGISHEDTEYDIDWLVQKMSNIRMLDIPSTNLTNN